MINKTDFIKDLVFKRLYNSLKLANNPDESMKDIRFNLLNIVLLILTVLGAPVIIIASVEAVALNQSYMAISYIIFYLPVFAAFVFRKKLHYNVLVLLLLTSAYLIGLGNLYIYGFTGANIPIFLIIFVLTTIFYNLKSGLVSIALSVVVMIVFAYLFTQNIIELDVALYNLPDRAVSWIAAILTLVFIGSIILASIGYIQYKMGEKIFFYEQQTVKLERDIIRRKSVEQDLKESEERYRIIVETASDWIWEINAEGKYTYSSPRVESILGYSEKEIIGKTPFDLMPEGEKGRVSKIFNDIVKHKKAIVEIENINIHKNGNLVVMETRGLPFFDINEKLLGYRGIDRDITFRKEAEKALKESEERLRLAQNAGKIGSWEWNVEKNQIVWSDMTYELFGVQKTNEIITSDEYFKHIHPEDKQRLITELDTSLDQKKEEHSTEYRIIVNNNVRWINETSRIITKSGELVKMIGVLHDITHQKDAQKALKDSAKRLTESNKTKDMFFSIIAHDLKSPFNTMMGFSDLLVHNFDDYDIERQKKFIAVINQGVHSTYKLLENLLLWSQTQRGTIDFKPESENLYLLIGETINLLGQQYINKSISLINKVPEDVAIIADKNMLLTILRNLISNAIKYTPEGGTVEIGVKTRHVVETRYALSLTEIYVKDSGVGIEKEKITKLFDISENVSTKGTTGETGSGLGLILCKEFVEKHGGKIWVESEYGKGSEFVFTLKTE